MKFPTSKIHYNCTVLILYCKNCQETGGSGGWQEYASVALLRSSLETVRLYSTISSARARMHGRVVSAPWKARKGRLRPPLIPYTYNLTDS